MAGGRRPVAQTALLIVAPLVLLAYAAVGGWLWWADQQEQMAAADPPPAEQSEPEKDTHAEPAHEPAPKPAAETDAQNPESTVGDKPEPAPDDHAPAPEHAAPADDEEAAEPPNIPRNAVAQPEPAPDKPDTAPKPEMAEPAPPVAEPGPQKPRNGQHGTSARSVSLPPLDDEPSSPLAPAPDPDLVIKGRYGPLPIRGTDGREAWKVYGRKHERRADSRMIAIVITELGLAEPATLSAIQDLPGEITLAFTPYSRRLDEWVPVARAAGHEVLLQIPMEPRNIELNDPGDRALLTTNPPDVNADRLEWVLSRATGYVGLTSFMGSRLTVSEKHMRPVLEALGARGLAWVDAKVTPVSIASKVAQDLGLPTATSDRFIDQQAARDPIDRRLAQLEQIALSRGAAVGFAQAYPVTIERLRHWIPQMRKRGFELAPVTATMKP